MPAWTAFTAITGVVLVLLLVLSHLTQSAFSDTDADSDADAEPDSRSPPAFDSRNDRPAPVGSDRGPAPDSDARTEPGPNSSSAPRASEGTVRSPSSSADERAITGDVETEHPRFAGRNREPELETPAARDEIDPESLSTGAVLANVAASQGLFAFVLIGAVIYTGVPADALGIEFSLGYLETGLLVGAVAGAVLYVANELGAAFATRFGFDHDEQLRELLAPDSLRGWLVLLLAVLPIIAVFEELLFRAALIGVVSAGFGVSPWLLAVLSSIAFAVGHGMQGSVGIVVTGTLGFVLATVFIVTGSFLVVVVAHYLINALEFVVHEGLELEWAEPLEG